MHQKSSSHVGWNQTNPDFKVTLASSDSECLFWSLIKISIQETLSKVFFQWVDIKALSRQKIASQYFCFSKKAKTLKISWHRKRWRPQRIEWREWHREKVREKLGKKLGWTIQDLFKTLIMKLPFHFLWFQNLFLFFRGGREECFRMEYFLSFLQDLSNHGSSQLLLTVFIYPNPRQWVGYDTRPIFSRVLLIYRTLA